MIRYIIHRPIAVLLSFLLMLGLGGYFLNKIPVSLLPTIDVPRIIITVTYPDHNASQVEEDALKILRDGLLTLNQIQDIGIKQFVLQQNLQNIQQCELYYSCRSESGKDNTDRIVRSWIAQQYNSAKLDILDAPNAFTQLFTTDQPYLEARFAIINTPQTDTLKRLFQLLHATGVNQGSSQNNETLIELIPDYEKMALYGITRQNLDQELEQLYGAYHLTDLKSSGDLTKVKFTLIYIRILKT